MSIRRLFLFLLVSLLISTVSFSVSAQEAAVREGYILETGIDGCSVYLTFIMPYPLGEALTESPLAITNTVYVIVFDEGIALASYEVTGEAGEIFTVTHPITGYFGAESFVFNLNVNNDADGDDYYDFIGVDVPDSLVAGCLNTICPYPAAPLLGQGRMLVTTTAYYGPSLDTLTVPPVVLNAGTSWWILEARDGFYKLFITCTGQYVWVPDETMGPNFDPVWNGSPLPDAGSATD